MVQWLCRNYSQLQVFRGDAWGAKLLPLLCAFFRAKAVNGCSFSCVQPPPAFPVSHAMGEPVKTVRREQGCARFREITGSETQS